METNWAESGQILQQLARLYVEAEKNDDEGQAQCVLEQARIVIDDMGLTMVNTKLFLMSYMCP